MENKYYKQKQFIAEVNEKDEVIGKIEKWDAHKKGILHRGYTAIITFQDQIILQHRKHPVFDNVFDFSFSSHQIYIKDKLQEDVVSILDGLQREWGVHAEHIVDDIKFVKKLQYKAFDDISGYYENEIDRIYSVELSRLPEPNYEFAYGFFTLHKNNADKLEDPRLQSLLAPWVNVLLKKDD
jgi:isopentenyl-diphosphate Delta-isomerase